MRLHRLYYRNHKYTVLFVGVDARIATALVLEGNLGLRICDIIKLRPCDIVRELARVCDISRTTAYKYKSLLETKAPESL